MQKLAVQKYKVVNPCHFCVLDFLFQLILRML